MKLYGTHRGICLYRPKTLMSVVATKAEVRIPHFRKPQSKVWLQHADGRKSLLWEGTLPPNQSLTSQAVLRRLSMAIAKRVTHDQAKSRNGSLALCDLGKAMPTLVAFLSDATYEDLSARIPGSVTIFCPTEGGMRLCLNDKDTGECAFVSGSSLTELLMRADDGLATGSLDWRAGKVGKKGR